MAGAFSLAFRASFDDLLNIIQATDYFLLRLQNNSVLSKEQVGRLMNINNYNHDGNSDRVFALLQILEKRDDVHFDSFISALRDTNQLTAIKCLRRKKSKCCVS